MCAKPLRVGVVGTGIFASDSHLPALKRLSDDFVVTACYNRSKDKAVAFAKLLGISESKVHESLEDIFADEEVDVIDALLPVQFNADLVLLAIKHNKPICFEKPIAANLEQAKKIVEMANSTSLPVFILEQWSYFKAVDLLKSKLPLIGNIVSFSYKSTGPFNTSNKYLSTSWRLKPEHIGGFLSDGGVHQLALLTGVLGEVDRISAYTKQVRELSGTDDIMYSTCKMKSGVIGTFTYGSLFGATDKSNTFEIMGDNGSIKLDFSPSVTRNISIQIGPDSGPSKKEIVEIKDENLNLDKEFSVFAELVRSNDKSKIISSPDHCYHHLAIVAAALESSAADGQNVAVPK